MLGNKVSISSSITWRCWSAPRDYSTNLLFKTSVFVGFSREYEPNDYTQHWKTIGKLEKFNLWSSTIGKKSNGDKNENKIKN